MLGLSLTKSVWATVIRVDFNVELELKSTTLSQAIQNMAHQPAAWASSGNLLEVQHLRPH